MDPSNCLFHHNLTHSSLQWETVEWIPRNGRDVQDELVQASMLVDNVETIVTDWRFCAQSTVLSVALDVVIDSVLSRNCSRE